MAVRNFPAAGVIRFAQAVDLTGAFSIFAVVKRNSNTVYHSFFSVENAAGSILQWALEAANTTNLVDASTNAASATNTGITAAPADGWVIIGVTKTAGGTTPRLHVYKAGAWVTPQPASQGTRANQASVTGGRLSIGQWKNGDQLDGRVAAVAVWQGTALSDAQVLTLSGKTAAQWINIGGAGACTWGVQLDQASTATAVVPFVGAATGAQTSTTGTAVVTGDDPPTTVFDLGSSTTPVGQSIAQSYTVNAPVGASLSQSYTVKTVVGRSLSQSYTIALTLTAVGNSLSGAYTVKNAVGKSLAQSYGVIGRVGRSLAQSYAVGNLTAGSSLNQRYKIYRTLVQVGPGNIDATQRSIVRTAAGRVYIFGAQDARGTGAPTTGIVRAYRSNQTGLAITQFTEVDTANRPITTGGTSTDSLSVPDCRLDPATGLVHMVYHDNSVSQTNCTVYYQVFDTTTDTWGTKETIATGSYGTPTTGIQRAYGSHALVIGNTGTIHVCYTAASTTVVHKSRLGANSWSAATTIDTTSTNAIHESMAVDTNGDLHLAWFSQEATRTMRYAKRTSGTWGAVEIVAQEGSVDDGSSTTGLGLAWHNNQDQCGSLSLLSDGTPVVCYLTQFITDVDDPNGNLVRIKVRQAGGTWTHDDPTRNTLPGVHAHTPSVVTQGNNIYALVAHGDAPNLWPGYAKKLSGGSWTGGSLGQETVPAGSSALGNTAVFDGSAYVGGTRTSLGAVGSVTSTLDGSVCARYDPFRDTDTRVLDVAYWDEDSDAAAGVGSGTIFYSAIPTELQTVGSSLAQTYSVTGAVGKSLTQTYTVKIAVGRSLSQTYGVTAAVGSSLVQPYLIPAGPASLPLLFNPTLAGTTAVGQSLAGTYTVRVAVGKSLAQGYNTRVAVGLSLAQSYYIGLRPVNNPILMVV